MAFDEALAARIRKQLLSVKEVDEKRMFGGVAFLYKGKMFCGVIKNQMIVRVGKDRHDAMVKKPHVRPFDFTGRPMRGFLYVAPAGLTTSARIARWTSVSLAFVKTLLAKTS